MKTHLFSLFLLLGTTVLAFACEKEPDTARVTEEEAAEIVSGALMVDSEGVSSAAAKSLEVTEDQVDEAMTQLSCGEIFDTTFTRTIQRPRISGQYSGSISATLVCNNVNLPTALTYQHSLNGNYATSRINSNDSGQANFSVTNLLGANDLLLNGSYQRSGSQSITVRSARSVTTSISMTVTDLSISKTQQNITGGTASFTLDGTTGTGETFSFSGTVVFNGNGTATITINGQSFVVDLN